MKKTDIERLKAAHLKNQMKQAPVPERSLCRQVDGELVRAIRTLAEERGADLGDVVTELLRKGLAG